MAKFKFKSASVSPSSVICKVKKKKMSIDSLPKEVVVDILTRLPVKSLCRFKCVSKSWLSTISTPNFSDSHFHRSRSNRKLLISICTYDSTGRRRDVFIADRQETEQEKKSALVLRHQATLPVKEIHITASLIVAGLTLSIGSPDVFVVTNPITKASVAFSRAFSEQVGCRRYVCFGFDPANGKHKVVESFYSSSLNRMDHRVCVVSVSDSGNWRSIEGPADFYFNSRQEVCIDGVIYSEASMMNGRCILAFDVRSEKFQVAMLSINGNLSVLSNLNLAFPCRYVEFEGKLAIVRYPFYYKDNEEGSEEAVLDLWVMEDFEKQVWSLKFSCLPSFASTRQLIGSTIDGELIFVELKIKDEPLILPRFVHYARYLHLREDKDFSEDRDVPFTLYFLNMKTGNFWSSDARLPPEYRFCAVRRISAAPLVERLGI